MIKDHPQAAKEFLKDNKKAAWHDSALWFLREKRDRAAKEVSDWENLRSHAAQIKSHTISHLATYLEEFETNANSKGIHVHWAETAIDHNEIIYDLLKKKSITKIVKSKSMLTEECHLNPFLEKNGVEVIDTDLGERIIQFNNEPPSHIVVPAIHLKKEEIGIIFEKHLNSEKGNADPKYLTETARQHLREKFLNAQAGITGANFGIAETGTIVVCTNEGNADLGTCLPPLHIVSMGIEKIIPKFNDLSVFLRLLARSATGQPITTYSSHFNGPNKNSEMHIVIVDNGRSKILAQEDFISALNCIRCGACLNTCPVYRRTGGHSYGYTIPGPIGSVLAPHKDNTAHKSLPFASSLCGSCTAVCPVKIDLHHQLLKWREVLDKKGKTPFLKKIAMKTLSLFLRNIFLYKLLSKTKRLINLAPRFILYSRLNKWGAQREMPKIPSSSFKEQYAKYKKGQHESK